MIDKTIIGEALRQLRARRSQRHVARRAGIPTGTWCQWEKGRRMPRDEQLPKILLGLDCSMEDLQVTIWRLQGERFLLRGSDLGNLASSALGHTTDRLQLRDVPPEFRNALLRVQEKLNSLEADVKALALALATKGPPPKK